MLATQANRIPPSESLRVAVAAVHARAEAHPLMQHLLSNRVSVQIYADYLRTLLPLYQCLESQPDEPLNALSAVFNPAWLQRSARIRADLIQLDLPDALPASHGTGHWTQSIAHSLLDRVAAHDGNTTLLPALAYVRYFGDLAGGQRLGSHLAEHLDHPNRHNALAFYHFNAPGDEHPMRLFKQRRTALDHALHDDNLGGFIASAESVFDWHLFAFDQIWARHSPA